MFLLSFGKQFVKMWKRKKTDRELQKKLQRENQIINCHITPSSGAKQLVD